MKEAIKFLIIPADDVEMKITARKVNTAEKPKKASLNHIKLLLKIIPKIDPKIKKPDQIIQQNRESAKILLRI